MEYSHYEQQMNDILEQTYHAAFREGVLMERRFNVRTLEKAGYDAAATLVEKSGKAT